MPNGARRTPGARLFCTFLQVFDMTMNCRNALGAALTALALGTGTAQAKVTADDVWAAIVAQYGALGADLTATLTRDGAVVTVSGISGSMILPLIAGGIVGAITVRTGDVTLTEGTDGTVAAMIGADWPVILGLTAAARRYTALVDVDLMVNTLGYTASFGGTPDDVRATSTYDQMLITLERLDMDIPGGAAMLDVDVLIAIQGGATQSRILQQGGVAVQGDGTLARVVVDYSVSYYEMQSRTVSETRDFRYVSQMIVPEGGFDMLNLAPALRAGLELISRVESGATQSQSLSRTGDATLSDMVQSVDTTWQSLALNADGIVVTGESSGIAAQMTLADRMSLPLGLAIDSVAGGFRMPLLADTAPGPAGLDLDMAGLTLSDGLWDLLGPATGPLRLPADLSLRITAQVTPRVDLVDFAGLAALFDDGDAVPVELNSVTLNAFRAAYAGAEVTGTGTALQDWVGIDDIGHLPPTTGSAGFVMSGANRLLQMITDSGLLGPTEMMGLRGGLAMIARPTGADEMTTDIIFGPDVGFVVNGQRID